ncbi:MAG: contractile injection system tape measure protein, partial [Acetobacteraceae bacterium]
HRAALLLDHVARGTLIAEEAHMPLIKLLVGLPIQAVLDPGAPLDAAERAACRSFLEAMLEHLAPLGRLTLEGLRGSWLLRPGLLERRDGLPLLRIERRGYDVLMDRLPWPRDWVRLPWMAEPLRVEW